MVIRPAFPIPDCIPGPYSQACLVQVFPNFLNTLYYRHAGTGRWQAVSGGMDGPATGTIYKSYLPMVLAARSVDTLYVKVSLRGLEQAGYAVKPVLHWQLTRSFLATGVRLPRLDAWLSYRPRG